MIIKSIFAVLLLPTLFALANKVATTKELLSSISDEIPKNAEAAPRKLVEHILSAETDDSGKISVDALGECVTDMNLTEQDFFKAVRLPKINPEQSIYFVRPSLTPYCGAFNGAHLFQYWLLVQEKSAFRILRHGSADKFVVYSDLSNASYDLAETNCTAVRCITAVLKFDGKKYKATNCSEKSVDPDKATAVKTVPCRE